MMAVWKQYRNEYNLYEMNLKTRRQKSKQNATSAHKQHFSYSDSYNSLKHCLTTLVYISSIQCVV